MDVSASMLATTATFCQEPEQLKKIWGLSFEGVCRTIICMKMRPEKLHKSE